MRKARTPWWPRACRRHTSKGQTEVNFRSAAMRGRGRSSRLRALQTLRVSEASHQPPAASRFQTPSALVASRMTTHAAPTTETVRVADGPAAIPRVHSNVSEEVPVLRARGRRLEQHTGFGKLRRRNHRERHRLSNVRPTSKRQGTRRGHAPRNLAGRVAAAARHVGREDDRAERGSSRRHGKARIRSCDSEPELEAYGLPLAEIEERLRYDRLDHAAARKGRRDRHQDAHSSHQAPRRRRSGHRELPHRIQHRT